MVFLSILVPCYNESKIILKTYQKISRHVSKHNYSYEIILYNDGSRDNTLSILKSIKLKDPKVKILSFSKNKGLGFAMRNLFNASKGKYVIQLDADLSTPANIISKLLKNLEKYDVVIASRYKPKSKIKISFKRFILSRIYNLIIKVLFKMNLTDTQSGFVGYKNQVLKNIKFSSNCFDYHIEFMRKIYYSKYKILEIPSSYVHRERDSKFNIFSDGMKTLILTIKLYFRTKNE